MLLEMVSWLNNNGSAVTSIATIALAIVTVFLAWATIQLANITKNQDKPWLHFYFMLGDVNQISTKDRLYVKNIGKGAALDVKFTVNHGLQHSFHALAPSQEYVVVSDIPPDNSKILEIDEITYKDINNKTISQQKVEPIIMNFMTYTDKI